MSVRPHFAAALAVAAVVALTAATAVITATVTSTGSSDPTAARSVPQQALAVPGPTAATSSYVPITPCRIVNTQIAGGKFTNGTTRTYTVGGTSGFPAQGGTSGGCGIPLAATAIAASLTANGPVGNGYVRAWPSNIATEPTATVLTYLSGPGNISGATLSIAPGVAASLTVRNHTGTTDLVIDVTGYYVQQIYATVNSGGTLTAASNRVVSASRLSTGLYQINVDRATASCTATASVWGGTDWYASTSVTSNVIFVYVWDYDGLAKNSQFSVLLTC